MPRLHPGTWGNSKYSLDGFMSLFLCDVFPGGGGIRQFAGDSEKKNDKDSTKTTKNGRFFGEGVSPPKKNLEFVRLPAVHM